MLITDVRVRLLLASSLGLVLELSLIRWLGANLVHLSYFSNIVLLASFLGLGLGLMAVRRGTPVPVWTLPIWALLVAAVLQGAVGIDRSGSDLVFFTSLAVTGPPPAVVLTVVFVVVTVIMAGPGVLIGQCFLDLPRLTAYRLDLIGSLAGIAVFTVLSFLALPPLVWGGVAVVLTLLLTWPRPAAGKRLQPPALVGAALAVVSAAGLLGAFGWESTRPDTTWSPYYKIETETVETTVGPVTTVVANGVPHQAFYSAAERSAFEPFYDLPYQRSGREDPGDVLVVGAGTGTDVALALLRGADSVDAVEIDPRIQGLGAARNPDRPYDDPRVTVHIADGREFVEQADGTYDTILFALPDSLTLLAGSSQLRLESYLFTRQAMESVRERLRPDGVFAMYNYYREPWLVGRLGATMADAFGHEPCIDLDTSTASAMLLIARDSADQSCGNGTDVAGLLAAAPPPAEDDRPFLYLRDRTIPPLYLGVILAILVISFAAVRVVAGPVRRTVRYTDLFLLGVAFLLFETRAVTMFALLFGTTWLVNAVVFAGILVAVLAAVEVTRWLRARGTPVPLPLAYAALLVAVAIAWLVPLDALLEAPEVLRAVLAGAITFLPVFVANVVFASRFDEAPEPGVAFGVNLLGAMVGGCLEYLALVTGYRALLVLVAVIYVAALLFQRTRPRAAGTERAPALVG